MPTVDISEAVMYNGVMYGPGQGVTIPDDSALQERIKYFNDEAKIRNDAALAGGLAMLPAGHPYTQMYPVVNNQPAEFTGEAVSQSSAMLQVQPTTNAQFSADGAAVSGTGTSEQSHFEPGYQSLTVVDTADTIPEELSAYKDLTPPDTSGEAPEQPKPKAATATPAPAPAKTETKSSS